MFSEIFSYAQSILIVILLFGGTVFIHELGHFLTALWFGLRIDAFAVGMGPALWQREHKGIIYKICALPIGGYVALPQLDITGSAFENEDAKAGRLEPVAPWKRIVIAAAGPFMNVVAALILCTIVYIAGRPSDEGAGPPIVEHVAPDSPAHDAGLRDGDRLLSVNDDRLHFWADFRIAAMLNKQMDLKVARDGKLIHLRNVTTQPDRLGNLHLPGIMPQGEDVAFVSIGRVFPDSAASEAGLRKGDRLVSINGIPIDSPNIFRRQVQAAEGAPVDLTIRRNGKERRVELTAEWDKELEAHLIGIYMNAMTHPNPFTQIRYFQGSIFRTLKAFVRPKEAPRAAQGVGGPVMILGGMHAQVRYHPMQALWFTALINVNLAIINLLPLVILDGGHIMVALFEMITGRKPYRGLIIGAANIMVVVLLVLMVWLSVRDVSLFRKLYSDDEETAPPETERLDNENP